MWRGEVASAGRQGRQRRWDRPERVYPADRLEVSVAESTRRRDERRLGALGIARATGTVLPSEPADVGAAGEPAVVAGVAGEWRVDPAAIGRPFTGRTAHRKGGTLVVHVIHQDVPFTPTMTDAVRHELDELASWLGLTTKGP